MTRVCFYGWVALPHLGVGSAGTGGAGLGEKGGGGEAGKGLVRWRWFLFLSFFNFLYFLCFYFTSAVGG